MYSIYESRRTATRNALALIEGMTEPYTIEGYTIVAIGVHENGTVYGLGRSRSGCGCIVHDLKKDANGINWDCISYFSEGFKYTVRVFENGTLMLWAEE